MGKGMKAGKKPKTGGGGNMQKQLAQMQAMQSKMEAVQEEIYQMETSASAGGGAVTAAVNGRKELIKLSIDKDVVDPDDVEMLEDLITAAINEAMRQMDDISNNEMNKLTAGFGLPAGLI